MIFSITFSLGFVLGLLWNGARTTEYPSVPQTKRPDLKDLTVPDVLLEEDCR